MNLTISHHVFLTKKQRYELHEGLEFSVVGISIPVWYRNKTTSEPANEVFCNYHLRNFREDTPIQILSDGYELFIPKRSAKGRKHELTDDEWRTLNTHNPEKLEEYYAQRVEEMSSKNLLDTKDGGRMSINYREHNKVKKNNEYINIMHYVQINDMEKLKSSLWNGTSGTISEQHTDSQSY